MSLIRRCLVFVARWDLDKTYLRTDFDTVRDLLRTALQRPDQKRTVPGAAALMRELNDAGAPIHILSGSPRQLRGRIVEKLQLDGVEFASLTLKPNLRNLLRLRFKALRGQLGYKLSTLLLRRCEMTAQRDEDGQLIREVLLGDDAEADAFVYSLYGDVVSGAVSEEDLTAVMRAGGAYEDEISYALRLASYLDRGTVVQRILIHLARQSAPGDFDIYGPRVVPFFNYLQAAYVLWEDGCLSPRAVLRVAQDLTVRHHFDGGALARSFFELSRRGHVSGRGIRQLCRDYADLIVERNIAGASELGEMGNLLERHADELPPQPSRPMPRLDYQMLVEHHNPRRRPS